MKQTILFLICTITALSGCKQKVSKEDKTPTITSQMSCAPVTTDKAWYTSDSKAPLFDGLGNYHFPITTNDTLVQRYFDQGMVLAYGFNHAEAARSFHYATKIDPNCPMAFWGFAYVLGPNYNAGMESDNYERAYLAIQKAIELSKNNAIDKEKDLIDALSKRYVKKAIEDRHALDLAYADALKSLYAKYPKDGDIGVLYAESLMNLHPWDLQDKDGNEKEWTPEIIAILENVLDLNPKHIGAHHFYIHAVEASSTPNRALKSAQMFDEGLSKNSGHLVHMPSHIYIRTGDYHKGTLANIQAAKVDSAYITSCHAQGAYPLTYYPHNQHFMAATATLEGNSKWAIHAANALQKNTHRQLMGDPGWSTLQHYYSIPFYVYVKFGKWDDILALTNETPEFDYPTAMLHYAKGMANLGKGNLLTAKSELHTLEDITKNDALKDITIWGINSVLDLVQIANKVLKAEILASENNFDDSIALLKEAIAIEDALNYNEPPDWFFSVRHNLGNIQLKAKYYEDAVETYQQDLKHFPKNGWALHGLTEAYRGLNSLTKQKETEKLFQASWATADVALEGSAIRF